MNVRLLVVSVLFMTFNCVSVVFGTGPLGPPTASLKKGQFGIAVEYARSRSDWEVTGSTIVGTMSGVESDMFIAQPAYGLTDDWEIYALLGVSNAEWKDFHGSYEFAYGFGTKVTFEKTENTAWGLLFELQWNKSKDTGVNSLADVNSTSAGSIDIAYYDITIALGPTWKVTEDFRLYGGPFFYVLEGDIDVKSGGTNLSSNLSEDTLFGGYVGAEFDICPNSSWYGEFRFTGDMMVFGTGIGWRF
jgi:hypothetical protein